MKKKKKKWCSNSEQLLECIPESERESPKVLEEQGINTVIKVLGILWDPQSDNILFSIKSPNFEIESESNTKRMILSEIAKLYDPLGFLSPVIVLAKLLMQQLWRSKVGWDDPVEEEISQQWQQLKKSLEATNQVHIPRRVLIDGAVCYELHGFADASMSAYGACIFIRSVLDESAQLQLLCSKSKVAPLKAMTIPRLELCAALLLARLVNKVLQSIHMPFHRVVLWSDSQIVLAWLRKSPDQLQVFVRNRVAAIREETEVSQWMYVRSESNPADIVSRGQMPTELVKNELWWHGPDFLKEVNFENKPPEEILEEDIPELRVAPTVLPAIEEEQLEVFSKYSSFRKLQRVIALVLRFASNCKKKDSVSRVNKTIPTVAELRLAMDVILKVVQREELSDEIARVESGEQCRKLGSLGPILVNGVLRVGGRLENSKLPFGEKHPIILPCKSAIVRMLIRALHEEHLHLGPTGLVHVIRRDFWLINAAATVRGVTRSCVRCFRVKPVDTSQYMGNLPSCRVTPAPPFSVTGVDYAGPFHIKQGLRKVTTVKGYVAVFVCMVTRAVHLELVSDMTTSAFIAALQRFVSRRGIVHQLHSDNGTNFRGAHHELNQLYESFQQEQETHQIESFCVAKGIEWQFIPADAPEFGGIWEAAVKCMKSHLKRIVGNVSLNFEQYVTILAEIEAILNSRPLFVTSSEPDSPEVITPAHYLIGRPLTAIPEPSYEDIRANRLDKWQHLQMLREHFWKAWSRDYLSSLQPRKKNQKLKANVIPGMIVLVHNRNLPPLQWKLGLVTKTFPGTDGLVRAVDIYSEGSTFRRPINKLSILPIEDNKAYFGPSQVLK